MLIQTFYLEHPSEVLKILLSVWGPSFYFIYIVLHTHTPFNESLELLWLWHTVKSYVAKCLQKSTPSLIWKCFIWTFSHQPTCSSKRRETGGRTGLFREEIAYSEAASEMTTLIILIQNNRIWPSHYCSTKYFTEAKESSTYINLRQLAGHQASFPSRSPKHCRLGRAPVQAGQLQASDVHVLC